MSDQNNMIDELEEYRKYIRQIVKCYDTICSVGRGSYQNQNLIGYYLIKNDQKIDLNYAMARLFRLNIHNCNGGTSVKITYDFPNSKRHSGMVQMLSKDLYGFEDALKSLEI